MGTINDELFRMLCNYSGALNDKLYKALGDAGYTGALPDRMSKAKLSGIKDAVENLEIACPQESILPSCTTATFQKPASNVSNGVLTQTPVGWNYVQDNAILGVQYLENLDTFTDGVWLEFKVRNLVVGDEFRVMVIDESFSLLSPGFVIEVDPTGATFALKCAYDSVGTVDVISTSLTLTSELRLLTYQDPSTGEGKVFVNDDPTEYSYTFAIPNGGAAKISVVVGSYAFGGSQEVDIITDLTAVLQKDKITSGFDLCGNNVEI